MQYFGGIFGILKGEGCSAVGGSNEGDRCELFYGSLPEYIIFVYKKCDAGNEQNDPIDK
jgi:hypothetical protein